MSLQDNILFPVGCDKVEKYKDGTLLVLDVKDSMSRIKKRLKDLLVKSGYGVDVELFDLIDEIWIDELGEKLSQKTDSQTLEGKNGHSLNKPSDSGTKPFYKTEKSKEEK